MNIVNRQWPVVDRNEVSFIFYFIYLFLLVGFVEQVSIFILILHPGCQNDDLDSRNVDQNRIIS